MKIEKKAYSIYELGQRTNQEDYIWPCGSSPEGDLFILCDGMGGHEKGEVASRTVCEAMSSYIGSHPGEDGYFTEDMFKAALSYALDELDKLDDGAEKKMGTTMTFLQFHRGGCLAAHIGDSRIYHIRPADRRSESGGILFKTRDHSLVNDLVEAGYLTPEQARTDRRKNIITRAMQPNLESRPEADMKMISDIRPGDWFYICSDGMLEQAEDKEIVNILSMRRKDSQKVGIFRKLTENNRDNHSAFLIHVTGVQKEESDTPVMETADAGDEESKGQAAIRESPSLWKVMIVAMACIVFIGICLYLCKKFGIF